MVYPSANILHAPSGCFFFSQPTAWLSGDLGSHFLEFTIW